MNILISFLLFIYVLVIIIGTANDTVEFYELIFWPIVFIKYLLIGLFKILFTNWKNFILIFVLTSTFSCNSSKGLHSNINNKFIKEHQKQQNQ